MFRFRRSHSLRSVRARIHPLLIGVLAAAVLGWFYFLATRGPKRVKAPAAAVIDDVKLSALNDEIAALETQGTSGLGNPATATQALISLQRAAALQRELLRHAPAAGDGHMARLQRLEQTIAAAAARQTDAEVTRLLAEAESAKAKKQPEMALEHLRAALAIQAAINQSNAEMSAKNLVRESQLKQQVETIESEPRRAAVAEALAKAEAALDEKRFADALRSYEAARDIQTTLNREYPRSPYANLVTLDRLEAQIASLQAAGPAQLIEQNERDANAALAAGKYEAAAGLYAEAKASQQRLNSEFARSRFASQDRVDALEASHQTALSSPNVDTVQRLDREIGDLLKAREVSTAVGKIRDAAALVTITQTRFPKSSRLAEMPDAKLIHLASRAERIQAVHEEIYGLLVPLSPGGAERMLTREVSQSLYQNVMGANPSRLAGEKRAVDSVSWQDAQVFCQWLSWQLGRRVRLPSEAEFLHAAQDAPRNASFHEMKSGVDEWLAADASAFTAPLAGQGSESEASGVSIKVTPKNERGRHIGFRVVVE